MSIFYSTINNKNLGNAAKYTNDCEKIILFVKEIEITDGKAEMLIIYSAINYETEKCGGVKSLSEFESDGESAIFGHKGGIISKLKKG